jgi:AcrR family transcriptional regulator
MSRTKERILDEAERAFAEKGIDGASLRFITGEARANLGSIHYYFGTKDGLVLEVFYRRIDEFNRARQAQLQKLRQQEQRPSLKAIWMVLAGTVTDFQRKHPEFVHFIERLLWAEDTRFLEMIQDREYEFDQAFMDLVLDHFPRQMADPVKERSVMLMHMINHAIVNRFLLERLLTVERISLDDDRIIEQMADIAVSALAEFQAEP